MISFSCLKDSVQYIIIAVFQPQTTEAQRC